MPKHNVKSRTRSFPVVLFLGKLVRLNLIHPYELAASHYYVDMEDMTIYSYAKASFYCFGHELAWREIDDRTEFLKVRAIDGSQLTICTATLAEALSKSEPVGPYGPYRWDWEGEVSQTWNDTGKNWSKRAQSRSCDSAVSAEV